MHEDPIVCTPKDSPLHLTSKDMLQPMQYPAIISSTRMIPGMCKVPQMEVLGREKEYLSSRSGFPVVKWAGMDGGDGTFACTGSKA